MITFTTEAATIDELRQKLLDAAGFGETVGRYTHEERSVAVNVADEPPKRTRRTKEQIAADEAAAANRTSSPNVGASEDTSQSGSQGAPTDAGDESGPTATDVVPDDLPQGKSANEDATVKAFYDSTVKPAVLRISQKHGRPGVEKLLAPYQVTNASHVLSDDYDRFLIDIEAALANDGYVS